MTSMDISENSFQTPANKKRRASESPSLPPASQPTMPPPATKTGLHSEPQVLTQSSIHK